MSAAAERPATESLPHFEQASAILVRRCLECHQAREAAGGLVLSDAAGLKKGGDSGPVLQGTNLSGSALLHRVHAGEMPPERKGVSQKLPAAEILILEQWIADGAVWPEGRTLDPFEQTTDLRGGRDWWSLQPVQRPAVPLEINSHPIDAFIRHRLTSEKLTPAPQADRRTLIRRLYLDLLGLPPTFEEIEKFAHDTRPDAWEQLVDQTLASPHFGERWGRYWLDLVRYAETSGYERDQPKPFAWKYRDWVARAIHEDMPYDRFLLEQLAGDELPDRSESSVIATGFLRLGTWNDEPNDPEDYKYERLEDLVHTTSSAFLGMTVKCARCHDHKFDPIPQADYYRMASAFWAGPLGARNPAFIGGPSPEELGVPGVLGWTDLGATPAPLHLLKNGERHQPRDVVAPASLSFWPGRFAEFTPPPEGSPTTHRRLQLAQWMADPQNPLTARVIVNRLWMHHLGQGLVRSPNNWGYTGEKPTHPELLDWLAAELVANGWHLKSIHRLILLSQTYQQASIHPEQRAYEQQDAANHLWWRAERRRMDAEAIRDALLVSSGEIDLRIGGEGFRPSISTEALEGLSRKDAAYRASPDAEQRRRSFYTYMQRSLLPPLMTTFDQCDTTQPCGQRDVSIVAPQALALLNNEFVHQRAAALTNRLTTPEGDDRSQIRAIWRAILKRSPADEELTAALSHLHSQRNRIERTLADDRTPKRTSTPLDRPLPEGLQLWLSADQGGVVDNDQRLVRWQDQSPASNDAGQSNNGQRPQLIEKAIHGRAAVRFDGQRRFLNLERPVLADQTMTIFAVGTDQGPPGHREILSNWNSDGNVGSSIFLGLTAENTVRLSDDFAAGGPIQQRETPFVLTASSGPSGVHIMHNLVEIASRSQPLGSRRLDTAWVIGQQGNINGEFWHGDLATLLVYRTELSPIEREQMIRWLMNSYGISENLPRPIDPVTRPDPRQLAWDSLCVVLFNSNEFLYVD